MCGDKLINRAEWNSGNISISSVSDKIKNDITVYVFEAPRTAGSFKKRKKFRSGGYTEPKHDAKPSRRMWGNPNFKTQDYKLFRT